MSSTHSAWLGEACSNQLAVFRDWFPHTFPSGPAMLQLKTYQVPESYGFTLWNILSYMYSVKLKFPFCRCGLLFGSQQSSEERNSLCIHAARIFNELLQDWNGPSQWLLHEGTAFPASLWKHKRVLLKKKKKNMSLQANLRKISSWVDQKPVLHFMWLSSTTFQIVLHLCKIYTCGCWKRRICDWRAASVVAVQPQLPLIPQVSFQWWI